MTIKISTISDIKKELTSRLLEALDSKNSLENSVTRALKTEDYNQASLCAQNAYHYARLAKTLECILYLIAD